MTSRVAVVLLSGGLDSATCLAFARNAGYTCHTLTFAYGQRHAVEVDAARRVAEHLGAASQKVLELDLRTFGGSALTADIPVPHGGPERGIPVTYVPARNAIFLAAALGQAEVLGTGDIFVGVNAVDYSGYPDCRHEFIEAFEAMANLALKASVEGRIRIRIHAPLIRMSKAEIIQTGLALGVDYGLTHSCYDPDEVGSACGECDACVLRLEAFALLGHKDPARYARS